MVDSLCFSDVVLGGCLSASFFQSIQKNSWGIYPHFRVFFSKPCNPFRVSMANREERIPESAFKVIFIPNSCRIVAVGADEDQIRIGVLYGTAMSAAAMRISLRIRSQRRLFLDDAFLLIASVALTAAVPVLYNQIAQVYSFQGLASGGLIVSQLQQSETLTEAGVHYQVLHSTYQTLIWSAIYSVKFSFLSFFRQIVDRVQGLVLYWKVVGVISIVAFGPCICFPFVQCPPRDYVTSKSGKTKRNFEASS